LAALIQALVRALISSLGSSGVFSERHRAWIRPLFVATFVAGCVIVVYALLMVATGHE
jgi:hypothetical protein